jgi:DNA-binding response OmpR family regulator
LTFVPDSGYTSSAERTAIADTYIKNLRKKIEEMPAKPRRIVTVYGVGYKFEA